MYKIRVHGDPILKAKAKPIARITSEIKNLAKAMIDLMIEQDAVGLAANQIGLLMRIFVMREEVQRDDEYEFLDPVVIINPVLLKPSKSFEIDMEGCLSIPGVHLPIKRPKAITLRYLTLDGKQVEKRLKGLAARIAMHETDHLDGILILDRLAESA